MAITKTKGSIGEIKIMADLISRGYQVAIPYGEDWRFDLILYRNGEFERIQCKYVESDGEVIRASIRSCNNWTIVVYDKDSVDWLAVYDKTTDCCYYIPSLEFDGMSSLISLRISTPSNTIRKKFRLAKDYLNI